jgi:uncharacterized protein (DUF1501 family)
MNQSRRNFLKKLPLAMSIPFTIGGIPINVMADNALTRLARASAGNSNNVLVILQMHGGNDGLNSVIPVLKYDEYYSKRANIAIPAKNSLRKYIELDRTLPSEMQAGLHPDMQSMKAMYDSGRVAIVQGVSYKNNNGSHFRGRDIWFMGGSADEYLQSGWVGRYLQDKFPNYPDAYPNTNMPDPLAIEIGSDVSLLFHQEGSIPASISLSSIPEFADLVENLDGFMDEPLGDPRGFPPEFLEGSPYFKELEWILSLEDKSKDYAARLLEVYNRGGAPSVTYPTSYPFNAPKGSLHNPLSYQLSMVARLLAGGCKTKVFLVKIGGFDTHADQVEKYDPTMGAHAALMYHISAGMKAFQDDLKARGLEDLVLTLTTSEFGRRVQSNGSYGTDHGTASPMFIFGKGVVPGVHGDAFKITPGNNLEMQYDYRTVYASVMLDWMGVPEDKLDVVFPGITDADGIDGVPFEKMNLAQQTITGSDDFVSDRFGLEGCFPNPAKEKTTVHFKVNTANQVTVNLMDSQGKHVKVIINDYFAPGEYKKEVELTGLLPGNYICQLKSGYFQESKKLAIIK